ncbi:MAG: NADH-quinone oxidoreductase subunit NuoN [Gammaproteobacteria bacterium]
MTPETLNFSLIIPELFMLTMACIALLAGLFAKKHGVGICYALVQIALLGTALLALRYYQQPTLISFYGSVILDPLAVLLKIAICLISFMVFWYSREYVREYMPHYQLEYYVLGLFAVLGTLVLVSAYNFLTLFLGVELFSLPVYAMIALRRDSAICSEAAMKYFVISAIASGMLLYGLSMLYGATQTIELNTVASVTANAPASQQIILSLGLVFVTVGIAFKLGAVPFHMWVPDVYEGAPSSVTLFIASAPKIAGLALALRLLVNALPGLHVQWHELLIAIALLSMALGNIVAIVQTNFKRMLAYSSIAQMGYMLLGLLSATPAGYAAATFYMISYSIMVLGAFGMLLLLNRSGFEAKWIQDFQGLNSRDPWLAFMMLLILFSMAGIPPIVGFMAKVSVLEALISVHQVWLAAVALLFAIIGAYYYIYVVKVMYFESPKTATPVACSLNMRLAMSLNGLTVLLLGLFPGALFNICRAVFY